MMTEALKEISRLEDEISKKDDKTNMLKVPAWCRGRHCHSGRK
jgi:hypothetical protein